MKASKNALDLIEHYESFAPRKYICPAGKPTIGYGHVILPTESNLNTAVLSKEEAIDILTKDVARFEAAVSKLVKVPLEQNEFDALISFVFNLGEGNLASSTLLKVINENMKSEAYNQFLRWNKSEVQGKMTELEGLTKRRKSEAILFRDNRLTFDV
jgi:lysozyme